jgi:membrane dipeptidase
MIVDGHLDIAWNALGEGRSFEGDPEAGYLVSRPALTRAGVGLVFATIFCMPAGRRRGGAPRFAYASPGEARLMALGQLGYYQSVDLPLLRSRTDLHDHIAGWRMGGLAAVLLMEGADPIEDPRLLGEWVEAGVRIIGPAWSRTRYSGGTGAPGGLTELGQQLLRSMRRHHLILDLSHLAEAAVQDAFAAWKGPLIASHSNARALAPGDRQISDATAAEIGRRGGVIGISFFRGHLGVEGEAGLEDVVRHARHLAQAAGGPEHVALGTDLDGGFPAAYAPLGSLSELRKLPPLLRRHFSPAQVEGIMGGNWMEFLGRSLPG